MNQCTCAITGTDFTDRILWYANAIFLFKSFALAPHGNMKQTTQGIYATYAHTVKTSRNLIGVFIKFSPCVQYCHYNLKRASLLLHMHIGWNASSIIFYGDGI